MTTEWIEPPSVTCLCVRSGFASKIVNDWANCFAHQRIYNISNVKDGSLAKSIGGTEVSTSTALTAASFNLFKLGNVLVLEGAG